MGRWFLRIFILFLLSICTASIGISFTADYFHTMFSVIGIMFSVSLSQVLTFSFSDITNEDFVKEHRSQLLKIQNTFIGLFSFAALFFFLSLRLNEQCTLGVFIFSYNSFFGLYNIFCLLYFVINFIGLVNLRNEIDDLIRKTKK